MKDLPRAAEGAAQGAAPAATQGVTGRTTEAGTQAAAQERAAAAADGAAPTGMASPQASASDASAQDRLQKILAAVALSGKVREDYQVLAGQLPLVLEVAGEIQMHKDRADHAAAQAYAKVHSLLSAFCEQTGKLSDAMLQQHEAVKEMLENPQDLIELLRSGKGNFITVLAQHGPVAGLGSGEGAGVQDALSLLRSSENSPQGLIADYIKGMQGSVEQKALAIQGIVNLLQNPPKAKGST